VTLTAGTLNINAALALGTTSTFTNNGGTIDNATAAAIAIVNPMNLGATLPSRDPHPHSRHRCHRARRWCHPHRSG